MSNRLEYIQWNKKSLILTANFMCSSDLHLIFCLILLKAMCINPTELPDYDFILQYPFHLLSSESQRVA